MKKNLTTLVELLKNMNQEEIIEWYKFFYKNKFLEYSRCLECGGIENKKFKQKTKINQFPKYLIIQLGRFMSCITGKINL